MTRQRIRIRCCSYACCDSFAAHLAVAKEKPELLGFARNRAAPEGGAQDDLASFLDGIGTPPGGAHAPADVPQAATSADLERLCSAKGGLCALALLDAAADGFAAQLDTFRAAAGKWAKQPLHFAWIDAAHQVRLDFPT